MIDRLNEFIVRPFVAVDRLHEGIFFILGSIREVEDGVFPVPTYASAVRRNLWEILWKPCNQLLSFFEQRLKLRIAIIDVE